MIVSGGPYQHIKSPSTNFFNTFCVSRENDPTSTHLVKWSIATRNKPMIIAGFWLIDPITLIPHVAKGHGDIKLNIKAGGALIFFTTDLTLMTFADIVDAILL